MRLFVVCVAILVAAVAMCMPAEDGRVLLLAVFLTSPVWIGLAWNWLGGAAPPDDGEPKFRGHNRISKYLDKMT